MTDFEETFENANSLNDEGFRELNSGNFGTGIEKLEKSAAMGQPNALGTLTWVKMLLNDPDGAIAIYNKHYPAAENFTAMIPQVSSEKIFKLLMESQLGNCTSNTAIAYYLVGDLDRAKTLLSDDLISDNLEAKYTHSKVFNIPLKDLQLKIDQKRELLRIFRGVIRDSTRYIELGLVKSSVHKPFLFREFAEKAVQELENYEVPKPPDFMVSSFKTDNGMTLLEKSEILVEFTKAYSTNSEFENFFNYNDLGIPIAVAIKDNLIELTPEGLDLFEETWKDFCILLGKSSGTKYSQLSEMQPSVSDSNQGTQSENVDSEGYSSSTEFSEYVSKETLTWLETHAVDMDKLDVFSSKKYSYIGKSLFNVETAEMFIANFYPDECDTCEDSAICNSCGKSPETFLSCMTANKDSDFLLVVISKKKNDPYLGTLIKFYDHAFSSKPNRKGRIKLGMPKVVPVSIGNIAIDKFGGLFFGDKPTVANTSDYVASCWVEGSQEVIAWIGLDDDGMLTPLALTTSNIELTNAIKRDVDINYDPPSEVKQCIYHSLSGTVFARFNDNREMVAELNRELSSELIGQETPIGESWIWQHAIHNDYEQFMEEILNLMEPETVSGLLFGVDLLRMRGQSSFARELIATLKEQHPDWISEKQKQFIELQLNSKPGAFIDEKAYELLDL